MSICTDTSVTYQRGMGDDVPFMWAVDGQKFVSRWFDIISASVAHVYHTALPFTPEQSLVKQHHKDDFSTEAKVIIGVEPSWEGPVQNATAPGVVHALKYSSAGSMIAVGGGRAFNDAGFGLLVQAATGKRIAAWDSEVHPVRSVSLSPDGQTLALASGSLIKLWHMQAQDVIAELDEHEDRIRSMEAHPAISSLLVSGDERGRFCLWDLDTRSRLRDFIVEGTEGRACWLRRAGQQTILVGCHSGSTEMWEVHPPQKVAAFSPLSSEMGKVLAVASSADGSLLASGSWNGSLIIYNAETGDIIRSIQRWDRFWSLQFSPTEQSQQTTLAIAAGSTVQVLHLDRGGAGWIASLGAHSTDAMSVAFSPDGMSIASGSYDRTVSIWEAAVKDRDAHRRQHHSGNIYCAHFSKDGQFVVSGSEDRTVRVWSTVDGELCRVLGECSDWVSDAVLLGDERYIVSSDGRCGRLVLWDWREGKKLCEATTFSRGNCGFIHLFAFTHGLSGVFSTYTREDRKCFLQCWKIEQTTTGDARFILAAHGQIPHEGVLLVTLKYSDTQQLSQNPTIVVECDSGERFTALCKSIITATTVTPEELHFEQEAQSSEVAGSNDSAVGPKSLCRLSESGRWVLDENDRQVLWLPPGYGESPRATQWRGKQLIVGGQSGRLGLIDFSNVILDSSDPF